jgi:hypothetical protein
MYTNEQKSIIDSETASKQITLSFPNHEIDDITNDRIYWESFSLEESFLDQDSIQFGKCNSCLLTVKVADFTDDINNAKIDVVIDFVGDETVTYPVGRFIVNTVTRTSDKRWKIITAMDYMSLFDVDISDWFNNELYPTADTTHKVSEIVDMLSEYIGVEHGSIENLPHMDLIIGKNIEPTSLSGRDLLQQICEINCCFGHFDSNGILQFVKLNPSSDVTEINTYRSCDYEDYVTAKIDAVQISMEDGDIGITTDSSGLAENIYTIVGNSLLYGFGETELQKVAETILGEIKDISYRPNTTDVSNSVYIELGDTYQVNTTNDVVTSYALTRKLSGIQSLVVELGASGTENLSSATTSVATEVTILKGKSAVLQKSIDGITAEFKDYAESTDTKMQANSEGLAAEISRATDTEGTLATSIQATAEGLSAEITRATESEGSLSTSINATAEGLSAEIKRATDSEGELSTNLKATAEGLSAEITRATTSEGNLSTKIESTAESIKAEVSKTYATSSALTETEKALTGQISDVDSKVDALADDTQDAIDNLQGQIDGAIETYVGDETPTLENYPANEWTDDKTKNIHIGDLYYVQTEGDTQGFCYRFQLNNGNYEWVLLKDSEITKAIQEASDAMAKATSVGDDLATNYSTTDDMNSAISDSVEDALETASKDATDKADKAQAAAIADTVEKLKSYSTSSEVKTQIEENSDSLKQYVSSNYTTQLEFESLSAGTSNMINGSKLLTNCVAYEPLRDQNSELITYSNSTLSAYIV